MTWRRHGYAGAAAVLAFLILSVVNGAWGIPSLIALAAIAAAATVLYLRYRRKAVRTTATKAIIPVTPLRDDRVIPQAVKIAVAVRDNGLCQLKGPPCTIRGEVYDHRVPYDWGGSSKDEDNIQMACPSCNGWKGNRWADTPNGRLTREEFMRLTA